MASTNKTANYKLNQWVENDKPRMEDFNSDNILIDAALSNKANKGYIEWTPTIKGATTAGIATTSTAYGKYVRSGDLVFISCRIGALRIPGGSGTLIITGLPETYGDSIEASLSIGNLANWPSSNMPAYVRLSPNNGGEITLYDSKWASITAENVTSAPSSVWISFSGTIYKRNG